MSCEVSGAVPVLYPSKWSWSFHLFFGRPMPLFPFGLHFSACLGTVSLPIPSMCCSHSRCYCFGTLSLPTPSMCCSHSHCYCFSTLSLPIPSMCCSHSRCYCFCTQSQTWPTMCSSNSSCDCLCTLSLPFPSMCCSHSRCYCFISKTTFCTPSFSVTDWFLSLSNLIIPNKYLQNFICVASSLCSFRFFSTQASLAHKSEYSKYLSPVQLFFNILKVQLSYTSLESSCLVMAWSSPSILQYSFDTGSLVYVNVIL
jgi:hypothetical protein